MNTETDISREPSAPAAQSINPLIHDSSTLPLQFRHLSVSAFPRNNTTASPSASTVVQARPASSRFVHPPTPTPHSALHHSISSLQRRSLRYPRSSGKVSLES